MSVPDSVLNKPAKLDEEMENYENIQLLVITFLKIQREILQAATIVARDHHEKWDGTGYQENVKVKIFIFMEE